MGNIPFDGPRASRYLWGAFLLSVLGDQISRVALTWHVWQTTQSTTDVAILSACYGAPLIIGGLLAGPLLDRYGATRVMLWDNAVRGVLMLAGAGAAAMGLLSLTVACLLAASYGLMAMITLAGVPAFIAQTFDEQTRAKANAAELIAYNTAGLAGPALATLLLGVVGIGGVLLVDSISYFAFAAALARIGAAQSSKATASKPQGGGVAEALRVIVREPILRNVTLMFMAFNIGQSMLFVLLPEVSSGAPIAGLSATQTYSMLITLIAVGEMISASLVRVAPFQRLGLRICISQFLAGAAIASLAANKPLLSVVALLAFGLLAGPLTVWAQTLRMAVIPAHMRGRVFALLRLTMQAGAPAGAAISGIAVGAVGTLGITALSGAIVGCPGLLGLMSKHVRNVSSP